MSDLREFKAWFKGFKENIKKPTEAQWKRVCEEIERLEITDMAPSLGGVPVKAGLKIVPGDPSTDPRFTPETMPKRTLNPGAAMDAGVPKK
jgi:hypothetical protein